MFDESQDRGGLARSAWTAPLLAFLVTLLAHVEVLKVGFVAAPRWAATTSSAPDYASEATRAGEAPLAVWLRAAQTSRFPGDPRAHHAVSLVVLALVAALLALWLSCVAPVHLSGGWRSLIAVAAAGLACLHPLHVEALAWLPAQGHLIATLALIAMLLANEGSSWLRTGFGWLAAALALLAAPVGLLVPLVALVGGRLRCPHRMAVRTAGCALLVLAVWVFSGQAAPGVSAPPIATWLAHRLGAVPMVFGWTLWPTGLSFAQELPLDGTWSQPGVLAGLGICLSLFLLGWCAWRAHPRWTLIAWVALAVSLFLGTWLPLRDVAPAEHALVPLAIPMGLLLACLLTWLGRWRGAGLLGLLLLCVAAGQVSQARLRTWQDESGFWAALRAERPDSSRRCRGPCRVGRCPRRHA